MKSRKPSSNKTYNLLSLFTGAGALDRGFELSGRYVTKVGIEYEPIFVKTLQDNQARGFLSDAVILNASVSKLKPNYVKDRYFSQRPPDGIIGGPPCETFSVIGNRKGLDDLRGNLVFNFLHWVKVLQPRFFLMENVPRLKTLEEGAVFDRLVNISKKLGYTVSHSILRASDYGAPTIRKRLFIIGVKAKRPFEFPAPTHGDAKRGEALLPMVTVSDAFADLPAPSASKPGNPQGHITVQHTEVVANRFAKLRQGERDNIRKRNRLDLNKPSPTLVAGNLHEIRSHIHPTEPRELTNRESARLHGFPDNFVFAGNHAAMGKQIANSVPISMAQALSEAIAKHLDAFSQVTRS